MNPEIHKYQMKVTYSCERLVKIDRLAVKGGLYWEGTVQTVHGLVQIQSWLVPMLTSSRLKYTFMEIVISGISYNVSMPHYRSYTCKGLSRMAGRFAKESVVIEYAIGVDTTDLDSTGVASISIYHIEGDKTIVDASYCCTSQVDFYDKLEQLQKSDDMVKLMSDFHNLFRAF